jgi:hypothetical protein
MDFLGRCTPVSDPNTERRVQHIMTTLPRREVDKYLGWIGPMADSEEGVLTTAKACTARHLLGKLGKT